MGFDDDGGDEAGDGGVVGKDADHVGAPLDFAVEPLPRVPTSSVSRSRIGVWALGLTRRWKTGHILVCALVAMSVSACGRASTPRSQGTTVGSSVVPSTTSTAATTSTSTVPATLETTPPTTAPVRHR